MPRSHREDDTRLELNVRIDLVPWDPGWPALYEEEKRRIRRCLSHDALLIEHVGSTAVPGLAAKPIIDIVLAVADSADEPSYLPRLESGGYSLKLKEPEWHEHRLLKGPDTDINLHVFSDGCPEIDRMILFRDRLRASHDDLDRYSQAKARLAQEEWPSVQDYADAKSEIVASILANADRGRSA